MILLLLFFVVFCSFTDTGAHKTWILSKKLGSCDNHIQTTKLENRISWNETLHNLSHYHYTRALWSYFALVVVVVVDVGAVVVFVVVVMWELLYGNHNLYYLIDVEWTNRERERKKKTCRREKSSKNCSRSVSITITYVLCFTTFWCIAQKILLFSQVELVSRVLFANLHA